MKTHRIGSIGQLGRTDWLNEGTGPAMRMYERRKARRLGSRLSSTDRLLLTGLGHACGGYAIILLLPTLQPAPRFWSCVVHNPID